MTKLVVKDLVNVRLTAPDLDAAQHFYEAFGLPTAERSAELLQSRGTHAGPPCQVVERGEPKFVGAAFLVSSPADLTAAATMEGASTVEEINEPGGGTRVRLSDPNGFQIELVHGVAVLPALPVETHPVNSGFARARQDGNFYRRPPGPARVKRLGHFVLSSPEVKASRDWYRETLGLRGSDDVYAADESDVTMSFSRLDRGAEYVDHHVIMINRSSKAGLNHIGFEVLEYDDIFFGEYHMKERGLEHRWGLGRHFLGSQVFNQWDDPWGRGYEHYMDSDVVNDSKPLEHVHISRAMKSQWGSPPPASLMEKLK